MPNCSKCTTEVTEDQLASKGVGGKRSWCKSCAAKMKADYRTRLKAPPQLPATPDGFTVKSISTELDADGEQHGKQWVAVKPEPIASADHVAAVPSGHIIKGVSTLVDASGDVVAQWIKTRDGREDPAAMLLEAMKDADCWSGKAEPIQPSEAVLDDDLLCVYPMGDPHIGMFAWGNETGQNHDTKIAERELCAAVDRLVELAPTARRALIISVGDFFHADNRGNTTTGGTPVDSDGRWPKTLAAGIRIMRRNIDRSLERHGLVDVIIEIGNHDWHTSIMLAICLAQFYENEPRVKIDTSPAKFHYYRFGANLIGTTHGDTVKLADLGEVMACDRPQDWGATMHRYWYTGHIHHDTLKELRGCKVESFRTLAPADAWHKGQGYRSGNDMKCLVLHKEFGEIYRNTVGVAQLRKGNTNG